MNMKFNLKFIGRTVRKAQKRWHWLGNVATQQEFNEYVAGKLLIPVLIFALVMLGLFEVPPHLL